MDTSTASLIDSLCKIESSFTKDCYFYYIVPDKDLLFIANWFSDAKWKAYAELKTQSERNAYRANMCRSDDMSDDDDSVRWDTDMAVSPPLPPGSEIYEDDGDEDIIGWNAVMSPWANGRFRTVTNMNNVMWMIDTARFFLIGILLSILFLLLQQN